MQDEMQLWTERRAPLTEPELCAIKEQLLQSIYADIGRSILKKILWVAGSCVVALAAWLSGAGYIKG